jgi:hypothetical protein
MEIFDEKLDFDFVKEENDRAWKSAAANFSVLAETHSFSMIPLDGKKPVEKDWTKWCRKKREFEESDFERRNAGVCCGPASGVIVLNIDDWKAFKILKKDLGLKLHKTFTVETGGGGFHYYYKYPNTGTWGNKSLKLPKFKNRTIFDIKGDGGVVVAPGGFHPSTGQEYIIVDDSPISSCPKWILEFIMKGINGPKLTAEPKQ